MTGIKTALLVDDHAVVRGGVRKALEARGQFEIFEAASRAEGMAQIAKINPALIVIDINLDIDLWGCAAARHRSTAPRQGRTSLGSGDGVTQSAYRGSPYCDGCAGLGRSLGLRVSHKGRTVIRAGNACSVNGVVKVVQGLGVARP